MGATNADTIYRMNAAVQWADTIAWPDDAHVIFSQLGRNDEYARIAVYCNTVDALRFVRSAVGHVSKVEGFGGGLELHGHPAPLVKVDIVPPAGSCERVLVGTETVVRSEPVGEVVYRDVEVVEPVYEWRCPESVLGAAEASV